MCTYNIAIEDSLVEKLKPCLTDGVDMKRWMELVIISAANEIVAQKDIEMDEKFNNLFQSWWDATCVYSGENPYYRNAFFCDMQKLGTSVLRYLDIKLVTEPEYKHRHIKWLRNNLFGGYESGEETVD